MGDFFDKLTGFFVVAILTITLSGCGGGGDGSAGSSAGSSGSAGASGSGVSQPITYPSTATIQSNMTTQYAIENNSIDESFRVCFATYGTSGNAVNCSVNKKIGAVKMFISSVHGNIVQLADTQAIDGSAIINFLTNYQTQDLNWLSTSSLVPRYTMSPAEVASIAPVYETYVNMYYSNVVFTLTPTSNAAVQNNFDINHSLMLLVVASGTKACLQTYGTSGNSVTCAITQKQDSTSVFLSLLLQNLNYRVPPRLALDKAYINSLLGAYRAQDLAWLNSATLAPSITMNASLLNQVTPGYVASINKAYEDALAQISAM